MSTPNNEVKMTQEEAAELAKREAATAIEAANKVAEEMKDVAKRWHRNYFATRSAELRADEKNNALNNDQDYFDVLTQEAVPADECIIVEAYDNNKREYFRVRVTVDYLIGVIMNALRSGPDSGLYRQCIGKNPWAHRADYELNDFNVVGERFVLHPGTYTLDVKMWGATGPNSTDVVEVEIDVLGIYVTKTADGKYVNFKPDFKDYREDGTEDKEAKKKVKEARLVNVDPDLAKWVENVVATREGYAIACITKSCHFCFLNDNTPGPHKCLQCNTEQCVKCQCEWRLHAGKTCEQYLMDQCQATYEDGGTMRALFETGEMQQCPKCLVLTQRSDGCNRMKCTKCGEAWCWACRQKGLDTLFTDRYDHYSADPAKHRGKNARPDPTANGAAAAAAAMQDPNLHDPLPQCPAGNYMNNKVPEMVIANNIKLLPDQYVKWPEIKQKLEEQEAKERAENPEKFAAEAAAAEARAAAEAAAADARAIAAAVLDEHVDQEMINNAQAAVDAGLLDDDAPAAARRPRRRHNDVNSDSDDE